MNTHDYTHLVRRLEVESTIHPAAFRNKVILISASAYVALFVLICGFVPLVLILARWSRTAHGVASVAVTFVLAAMVLASGLVVLRMLLMRHPAPDGRIVTQEEAPQLFETLARIRRKLKGPPIHHVLIGGEFNAAIMQMPRFGMFGGHTNYLMLGLPYLLGCTSKEVLATVTHEYAHLCGRHGKLGAWVYRQRRSFGVLYEQVREDAEENKSQALAAYALKGFMAYFNAYTFVMARQHEYLADRAASELFGAEANANGLIRGALLGRWIEEEFWPQLYREANTALKPSFMPYNAMRKAFKTSSEEWATHAHMSAAWLEKSSVHDTHPSLCERVEATGAPALLPSKTGVTAAEKLLGARLTKGLMDEFDTDWWSRERDGWVRRHNHAVRSRARLENMATRQMEPTTLLDLQEFALLTAEFDSSQAAKPVLERLLKQSGGPFPKAAFTYGRILLDEGNRQGLDFLKSAARDDETLIDDAAHRGYYFLLRNDGEELARAWWEQMVPQEKAADLPGQAFDAGVHAYD